MSFPLANVSYFPARPGERSTRIEPLMSETEKTSNGAELMENCFVVPTEDIQPPMILKCKVVKRPGNHLLQRELPRSGRGEVFRLAEIPSVNSRDRPQDRHRSSTTRRRCSMFVASRSPSRRVGSPRCAIPTLVLSIVATGGPAPCMAQGLGHGIPTPPPVDSSFRQINDEHHGTPQAHLAGPRIAELKRPIKYRRFRELEGHDVREQS